MKERPILFSAPMVLAILEGRKTVTRRIAKPRKQPSLLDGQWSDSYVLDEGNREWLMRDNPYGQPGDRLWVRETCFINGDGEGSQVIYRADPLPCWEGEESEIRWRPSIHMPRWASRILLEITDVRVERLQDISEVQAMAEGAKCADRATGREVLFPDQSQHIGSWKLHFQDIWESINGPGSWDTDPWVWVVEFKRIEQ